MMHVFLLLVYIGTGEERKLPSGDMYFYNINDCNYYAEQISKRYGNYSYHGYLDPQDRVTAYCLPKFVNTSKVNVY